EGRRVHRDGAAVHERLGHELTGDGTVHEAVAAEAGDDVESRDAGDGADDARLIRRHLVEARVRTHELRLRERGRAVDRALDDAPVAMTTAPASNAPCRVTTPRRRSPSRRNAETSCCWWITTPSPRARAAIPVAQRYGSA